jgi:hypothetical protein
MKGVCFYTKIILKLKKIVELSILQLFFDKNIIIVDQEDFCHISI